MTSLSAYWASSNPQDDMFGHAPFVDSLVDNVCQYLDINFYGFIVFHD